MTQKKIPIIKPTLLAIASLYTLIVSLLMVITSSTFLWPFILFVIVSLSSGHALYRIYKGSVSNTLLWIIVIQALLASLLLYPTMLTPVIDLIGLSCNGAEQCSEDLFFPYNTRLTILVPMLVLVVLSHYKSA